VQSAEGADVALVELPEESVSFQPGGWHGLPPLGLVAAEDLAGGWPCACQAVGFPRAQLHGGRRDFEQLIGHIAPLSTGRGELLTVHVHGSTPLPDPDTGSGWSGMSGAAVFVGPYLVGVVVTDPTAFAGTRVEAAPITAVMNDPPIRELLETHIPPELTALEPQPVHTAFSYDLGGGEAFRLRSPHEPIPPALTAVQLRRQPSILLYGRYGAVPFIGRKDELGALVDWCTTTEMFGVRLLTGPGGAGKSRLAAELCTRLLGDGWDAGIVEPPGPGPVTPLMPDRRALFVVDYAGARVDLIVRLVSRLILRSAGPPVRVLLIARSRGHWFESLLNQQRLLRSVLEPDMALGVSSLDSPARDEHYEAAARSFARFLEAPHSVAVPPVDLLDPAFRSPLLVHMKALLGVLTGDAPVTSGAESAAAILDEILTRESSHWDVALEPIGVGWSIRPQVVAVGSIAGAACREDLTRLLTAVSDLDGATAERLGAVADAVHDLYPGAPYLAPIEPDALTERLAGRHFSTAEALTRIYDRANTSTQVSRLLTVLIRGSTNPLIGPVAEDMRLALQGLIAERLPHLLTHAAAPVSAEGRTYE
jgi:hypothetical protein